MQIGNAIARTFQLLFVPIVLGLSIHLVIGQVHGSAPSQTSFAVACGALGAIALLTGIAALFVQALQGLVMMVIDALATLFFLAGSIALAVALGVHSCTDRPAGYNDRFSGDLTPPNPYCASNRIINGGDITIKGDNFYYTMGNSWFVSRCREAEALDAFMFFSLIAFAASLAMDFFGGRPSRTSTV